MDMYFIEVAVLLIGSVVQATPEDLDRLYNGSLNGYNKHILPQKVLSDPVYIDFNVYIISINTFDEMSGEVDMTVSFDLQWDDERITWTPSDYGNIESVVFSSVHIWRPHIYLFNAADKLAKIGQSDDLVRVNFSGKATWNPAQVIKFICSVNMKYYPFDTQTCDLKFITWSYIKSEVLLRDSGEKLKLKYYMKNSNWEFLESTIQPGLFEDKSMLRYEFKLKRKPGYFIVYIISPIVLLGILNNLVFAMPFSSGERMSVAVTALLSYAVYMEVINNNVPGSSDPVASIFFYLLFLMVHSSAIMILTVASQRIHDKEGPVYKPVVGLTKLLRFYHRLSPTCLRKWIRFSKNEVADADTLDKGIAGNPNEKLNIETKESDSITWCVVGDTIDGYLFVLGIILHGAVSFGFIFSIYKNTFNISPT